MKAKPQNLTEKLLSRKKMIDLEIMERTLKTAWIKRIAESGDALWKTIVNYGVRQFGGIDFLINCDYDVKTLNLEQLPEFCRTVLCHWQELKCSSDSKDRVVYKFFSSWSFVKSRRFWVQRTHTMGLSPSFLGGPGTCSPGTFLETGMLENAFPGVLGHETQTFEE